MYHITGCSDYKTEHETIDNLLNGLQEFLKSENKYYTYTVNVIEGSPNQRRGRKYIDTYKLEYDPKNGHTITKLDRRQ